MGSIENLNLNIEDFDKLLSLLSGTEDDFEALNVLVGFFEDKMKSAAVGAVGSFEEVQKKIDETKLNIQTTEQFIKDINKQIGNIAPGRAQADLISERNAAAQALKEEKVALADYQVQLKKARQENATMTSQLRKLKDELIQLELAGERGSDRWIELTDKAEDYREAIKSTNDELNRQASSTEQLDNVIGAVNGIIGVYAAAQGAAALFGDENEDLQKSLVKLNGALALLNGLQAIQVELAKKETIAGRALAIVKGQYAIATDASAKSTLRLAAATKLLGIGLIVGALAAIVVYWEDISKFIGLTSDATEDLNSVQKKSNEIIGTQIAELSILVDRVKQGGLSFNEKQKAVKDYNEEFGSTLGAVKDYAELEERLIKNGDSYIEYLGLKAKAEAAYTLAVEKSREALELRNSSEANYDDYLTSFFTSAVNLVTGDESLSVEEATSNRNEKLAKEKEEQAKRLLQIEKETNALRVKATGNLVLALTK